MIPIYHLEGQNIAIFGLGRSGLATALAARAGGANVFVYDANETSMAKAAFEGFIGRDLTKDLAFDDIDQLIVSPGIPHLYPAPHPIILKAMRAGVVVNNDIGLFFKEINESYLDIDVQPRIVAVTGSNGKSTTTALIAHLLEVAGHLVEMGGNIGRGVFDLSPPDESGTIYVVELSSYQTDLAVTLTPDCAVFLNLSPDHLDRHNGLGGYFRAKSRLFTESLPRSFVSVDDVEGLFLEGELRAKGARVEALSTLERPKRQKAYHVKRGFLAEWNKGRQASSLDLRSFTQMPGRHNWQNMMAAYAVARAFLVGPKVIEAGLQSFKGLAHRAEILGEIAGVNYVNDSKATNAESAYHALAAFENVHWIAGGVAKEGGIEALSSQFARVKKAYLIGEAKDEFAETLKKYDVDFEISGDLESACHSASKNAAENDIVLLSPAAASFDQYKDFEARGEAFRELFMRLKKAI